MHNGGGWPNLLEQQELTASITRKAPWVKGYVDLAELAKLRQIHKLKITQMAAHFGVGATRTMMNSAGQARSYGLISLGKLNRMLISGGKAVPFRRLS